jgi:HK97 family phage portal protein
MGLLQRLFRPNRQKTAYSLNEFVKFISTGDFSSEALLEQYSKSLYVFASINKIAQKISAIDLKVFEILNSRGDVKEHVSHEVLDLLYRPNPFQTRSEFWKITTINKKLTGEAFWLKVRGPRNRVLELWNLRPDMMTIHTDPQKFIKGYTLRKLDGTEVAFEPEDIIHFKEPNPQDVYRGLSPIKPAQSRIMTEDFATTFQRDFFANNARPDALLISEDLLAPEQRDELAASWNAKHKGKGKNSRIGILEGGMTYQQVSVTQKEMDYIESLRFTRDDILVAFGVPKSIITTDDVNRANAQEGLKTFLTETIIPEITALNEVINEMLVIPDFGERLYVDFDDPTPVDREMQLKEYTAGYGKWLTPNEIRAELNLKPVKGGDTLEGTTPPPATQPQEDPEKVFRGKHQLQAKLKMIEGIYEDVKKGVKPSKKKAKQSLLKGEIRESYKAFINKKIDKRAQKFQKQVLSESDKQMERVLDTLKAKDINLKAESFNFDKKKENQIFSELALPFMTEAAQEAGQEALDLVGVGEQFEYTDTLEKRLKERAKFFAKSVNDTTLEKLTKTIAEGIQAGEGIAELTKRVKDVYQEFSDYRAESIARTESTAVNNEGFLEAYSQSKVVNANEWIATKDSRVRHSHASIDGEIVEVGKTFSNGLRYPGDANGDASETVNCRCVLSPSI